MTTDRLTPTAEAHRREGWADALIALAMVDPTAATVGDYVDRLDKVPAAARLTRPELDAALRRWRARTARDQGAKPAQVNAVLDGRHLELVTGPVAGKKKPRAHAYDPQTCDICGRIFRDKRALAGHKRTVHQPATCPICGLETTAGGLGPHRVKAHPQEDRPA